MFSWKVDAAECLVPVSTPGAQVHSWGLLYATQSKALRTWMIWSSLPEFTYDPFILISYFPFKFCSEPYLSLFPAFTVFTYFSQFLECTFCVCSAWRLLRILKKQKRRGRPNGIFINLNELQLFFQGEKFNHKLLP